MYPKPIQNLIEIFSRFPGVGPRQAARFSFFLFQKETKFLEEFTEAISGLSRVGCCNVCFRTIEKNGAEQMRCAFCADSKRDHAIIAVVEKEADLQNLEHTGMFKGLYHVLGGIISPLDLESPKRLRLKDLHHRVQAVLEQKGVAEVILATSSTTEGDTTALYIERILAPIAQKHPRLVISRLGRGLSLGAELEYADEITLKNALTNRK
ncbi:MAG: recombination protein RecR [Candidatus Sungbacteria bacterium]|nr:recombination protein RecR [Candidatus Sungbacteria bacterium]